MYDNARIVDAGFLFPVIDGVLYVGQRGTEPHMGLYGPIGGKSDKFDGECSFNEPGLVIKPGGHIAISMSDVVAELQGRECVARTSVREFCEEVFTHLTYPTDFLGSITDVLKLGWLDDHFAEGIVGRCYFHLATVRRRDFQLSARELTDFCPLSEVGSDQLFPITKVALVHLKYLLENPAIFRDLQGDSADEYLEKGLEDQIPLLTEVPRRFTCMPGVMVYYASHL